MTEDEPAKARALFNELLKKASFSAESAKVLMRQGWEEVYTFRPFEADGRLDAGDINLAIKKIPRTDEGLNGATFCIARDEQSAPDRVFILLKKTKEISTLYIEQYLQEITQSLREAKNSCARVIEWELVKRKLDLLQVKKDALPLDDGEFLK